MTTGILILATLFQVCAAFYYRNQAARMVADAKRDAARAIDRARESHRKALGLAVNEAFEAGRDCGIDELTRAIQSGNARCDCPACVARAVWVN